MNVDKSHVYSVIGLIKFHKYWILIHETPETVASCLVLNMLSNSTLSKIVIVLSSFMTGGSSCCLLFANNLVSWNFGNDSHTYCFDTVFPCYWLYPSVALKSTLSAIEFTIVSFQIIGRIPQTSKKHLWQSTETQITQSFYYVM